MNNFWHHDVLRIEPSRGNSASLDSVNDFLDEFEDIDSLWQTIEERDFHPLSFRLPNYPSKPLNSLGKTNLIALYAEFSENNDPTGLNLGYDDEALKPRKVTMPAVTAIIDGEEYGELPERDNSIELPVSTLPDLYGIGLARQYFDPELNFKEDSSLHIENRRIAGIGRTLKEKYDFDDRYEFFFSQGENIEERAEEIYTDNIVEEALEEAKEEYEER